jgi:hypothetical protein
VIANEVLSRPNGFMVGPGFLQLDWKSRKDIKDALFVVTAAARHRY